MNSKHVVVILSDPKSGEEALGRLLNAMAFAHDLKQSNSEVLITFQGTGTRWIGVLEDPKHPAYGFLQAVKDKVLGISCGCSDVFGTREAAEKSDFALLTENMVPGTSGLPPLARLAGEGYQIVTF